MFRPPDIPPTPPTNSFWSHERVLERQAIRDREKAQLVRHEYGRPSVPRHPMEEWEKVEAAHNIWRASMLARERVELDQPAFIYKPKPPSFLDRLFSRLWGE